MLSWLPDGEREASSGYKNREGVSSGRATVCVLGRPPKGQTRSGCPLFEGVTGSHSFHILRFLPLREAEAQRLDMGRGSYALESGSKW